MNKKKPTKSEVVEAARIIGRAGMFIFADAVNLKTGERGYGCMDLTPLQAGKFYQLKINRKIWVRAEAIK